MPEHEPPSKLRLAPHLFPLARPLSLPHSQPPSPAWVILSGPRFCTCAAPLKEHPAGILPRQSPVPFPTDDLLNRKKPRSRSDCFDFPHTNMATHADQDFPCSL